MRRVLIITYYWPPSGGAGVQRWLKFSKYLPENGWEPVIYTPENPEAPIDDPSLIKDIRPGTEVIKTPIWEPYQFYKKFLGMSSGERINAGFLNEKEKPGKKELWSIWIRGNLFIPDARKYWIKPSVKFLSTYLKNHPVDAIISTGPPHSMHLIAQKLSESTGIPWLADFRDPWTAIDFYDQLHLSKKADRKHHKQEKEVLQNANEVVVIGKTMAQQFKDIAGINPTVITNGFDEEDYSNTEEINAESFTIVHVGAINKDRNHESFWKAVSEINSSRKNGASIHLKLIGKLDVSVIRSIKSNMLEDCTEIIPYMNHDQVAKELKSASVLYLPINNTPNAKAIQTGKLFEYLASGRPILGVGPEDGDAANIINDANAGIMIDFQDKDKIYSTITKYREDYIIGKKHISNNTDQFSRRTLTKLIAASLNKIAI